MKQYTFILEPKFWPINAHIQGRHNTAFKLLYAEHNVEVDNYVIVA